ncbi:hypothetical protein AB205_0132210 [Aquarana catesbeiana]|uniref:Uncharacterized protein n=1 Tax=Aquarana catesbeiana TaxID=8400 RepID=A0A2G9NBA0_AQUCT|nr:hypothetical protein AB205_0132210 [Aquarana catesbeiana]
MKMNSTESSKAGDKNFWICRSSFWTLGHEPLFSDNTLASPNVLKALSVLLWSLHKSKLHLTSTISPQISLLGNPAFVTFLAAGGFSW